MHTHTHSHTHTFTRTYAGVGVAMFGHKSSNAVSSKLENPNTELGYVLCGLNLCFDGYTNTVQVSTLVFVTYSREESGNIASQLIYLGALQSSIRKKIKKNGPRKAWLLAAYFWLQPAGLGFKSLPKCTFCDIPRAFCRHKWGGPETRKSSLVMNTIGWPCKAQWLTVRYLYHRLLCTFFTPSQSVGSSLYILKLPEGADWAKVLECDFFWCKPYSNNITTWFAKFGVKRTSPVAWAESQSKFGTGFSRIEPPHPN